MRYFQLFRITGAANGITYDDGLKSTEVEKKRLVAVHAQLSSYSGTDDNDIQGWHERAKVFDFPEGLVHTQKVGSSQEDKATARSTVIPVDLDIPVGETFKAAIKCSATARRMRGVYEYEIIS